MSALGHQRLKYFNMTFDLCRDWPVCNRTEAIPRNLSHALEPREPYDLGDDSSWLRFLIATVYFAVSAVGLVGNATVLFLLRPGGGATKGAIDLFVVNLAAADLLFSAAMPLWAVDTALDYRWPFGGLACKMASFLTSLNVFASVLFLAAMSVTRYCSVALALRPGGARAGGRARPGRAPLLGSVLIWAGSVLAAAPRAAFAEVAEVGGDSVCLLHFPQGTYWLGLHHLLRVVLGFLLPYAVIVLSYLLLLRFLCNHGDRGGRRRARVSRSVAAVILAFCVCWLPNNVLTVWSLLVHLDAVTWSAAFYAAHTYVFPLTACLAQANGCLNPALYCLMRREHRRALGSLLCGPRLSAAFKACLSALGCSRGGAGGRGGGLALPLHSRESQSATKPPRAVPPSTSLTTAPSPKSSGLSHE
ncbi:relaxin-3 receptor 2-like [Conger conger]|uniref:relaxin-3 receptor 2-like n=1 Tax=Conger conger TaxID=82655 RepID=UPI002A5A4B06|nr:relaxin-3 receptor 2-like [Conger conger]